MRRTLARAGLLARAVVALAMLGPLLLVWSVLLSLLGAVLGVFVAAGLRLSVGVLAPGLLEPLWPTFDLLVVLTGACWGVGYGIQPVREEFRRFEASVYERSRPAGPDDGSVVPTVARLAGLAGVAAPAVRIADDPVPTCMTVHAGGEPTVVLSTGLTRRLTDRELEAVLAHEVAHVASADHRLLAWAVAPLVAVESTESTGRRGSEPPAVRWARLAVGLFSRGREFAADRTAAELTGDPAALASALETLAGGPHGTPSTDAREYAAAADALSVYPAHDPDLDAVGGLLATHPATRKRVERLRRLAGET